MRWTRNDTAAYEAVSKAGQSLRDAYDKYQLGSVYGQGGEVTENTLPEEKPIEPYQRELMPGEAPPNSTTYRQPWESQDAPVTAGTSGGLYRGAPAEGRAWESPDASVQKEYQNTPASRKKYTVGHGASAMDYDTAPTREQIHRGGLTAQYEHLSRQGDVDAAGKILERISASDAAEQQRKLGGLQINKFKTDASERDREISLNKELEPVFNQIALMPDGPEKEAATAQLTSKYVSVHGFAKGVELSNSMQKNSADKMTLEVAKQDKLWRDASESEEKMIARYNKDHPDDKDAHVRVNPTTGMRIMVTTDRVTGEERQVLEPYKSWRDGGMQQVLGHISEVAKKTVELNLTHTNKMAEIGEENKGKLAVANVHAAAREDIAANKEPKHYIGYDESGKPVAITAGDKGWEVIGSGAPYHGNRVEVVGPGKTASRNPEQSKMAAEVIDQVSSLPTAIRRNPTKLAEETARIEEIVARLHGTTRAQAFPSAPGAAPTAGKTGSNMEQRMEANRAAAGTQSATPSATPTSTPQAGELTPLADTLGKITALSKERVALRSRRDLSPDDEAKLAGEIDAKLVGLRASLAKIEGKKNDTANQQTILNTVNAPTPAPTPTPEDKKAYQTELDRQILVHIKAHPNISEKEIKEFSAQWLRKNPGGSLKSIKPLNEGDRQILLFRKNYPNATEQETDNFTTQLEKENPEIFKTPPKSEASAPAKAKEPTPAPVKAKEPAPTPAPVKAKEPAPTPAPVKAKEPAPVKAKEPAPTPAPVKSEGPAPAPAKGSTLEEMQAQLAVNSKRIAAAQKANREAIEKLQKKMQQEKENR